MSSLALLCQTIPLLWHVDIIYLLAGIFTRVARITATGVEILILLAGRGAAPQNLTKCFTILGQKLGVLSL